MNEKELHAKLIAAARKIPPRDHVPYGFEKRIMNRLSAPSEPDVWALWAGPMWRAAISCVAITIVCGLWSFASSGKAQSADNFSQDFEAAIFAPPSQHVEDAW